MAKNTNLLKVKSLHSRNDKKPIKYLVKNGHFSINSTLKLGKSPSKDMSNMYDSNNQIEAVPTACVSILGAPSHFEYDTPQRTPSHLQQSRVEFNSDYTPSGRHQSVNGGSCHSDRSETNYKSVNHTDSHQEPTQSNGYAENCMLASPKQLGSVLLKPNNNKMY